MTAHDTMHEWLTLAGALAAAAVPLEALAERGIPGLAAGTRVAMAIDGAESRVVWLAPLASEGSLEPGEGERATTKALPHGARLVVVHRVDVEAPLDAIAACVAPSVLAAELAKDREALAAAVDVARDNLVDAAKLATVGTLAAGVAHDLATPVGVLRTATSLLRAYVESTRVSVASPSLTRRSVLDHLDKLAEPIELIEANVIRAAERLRDFKGFAAQESAAREATTDLVPAAHALLASLAPMVRELRLDVHVEGPGATVRCDPGAVAQVLTNLVQNAGVHGYGESGGKLVLRVEPAGSGARITVTDEGVGVPQASRARLFDAFYTTRAGRGGTGLGLFVARLVARRRLRGDLVHAPAAPSGSTFTLTIDVPSPR